MMSRSTHRSWVIILALVMVSATAQMVSADAGSQRWNLSHDKAGDSYSSRVMYKGSQDGGTGLVWMLPKWWGNYKPVIWIADQPAECNVGFAAGNWNGRLTKITNTTWGNKFDVDIGVWDGSSFTSYGIVDGDFGDNADADFTISASEFDVPEGQYLALKITNTEEGHWYRVPALPFAIRTPHEGLSYVSSPPTDPDCPVPELPTLVLVSAGLLILVGYAYMGRRNR